MTNFVKKLLSKKVILITTAVIVLLAMIGGGVYYWWTGTPEYSVYQIKKAVQTHNSTLGLKYVDTDAVFEGLWADMKSQLTSQSFEQEDGFGMLGAALGLQLLENTKPTIKEQFLKGIDSWFTVPTEEAEQIADENEVGVKISGPESANSGDKVVYLVKYQNKKKVAINNVSLNVRYPVGLAVGDVKPSAVVKVNSDENSDSNSIVKEDNWEVGTLEPEQSGQVEISGQLIAETDSNQNVWAVLYYKPANFTSQFQSESSFTTTMGEAPVKSATDNVGMNNIWKKDYKLKKQGGKVYLEIPTGVSSDSVKMILTQKPGERYWVISKVEGLVSSLFSAMENAQKEADNK